MGRSYHYHGSVTEEIKDRLPVTIELVILSLALSLAVGIPSGILSAVRQNTWLDVIARVLNVVALSVPSFCCNASAPPPGHLVAVRPTDRLRPALGGSRPT
jgi:ABC-type dipeptide/oligopeptide/nickel transport system permease component